MSEISKVLPQAVKAELLRLGEIIRAARVGRGMTQAEAAKRLRVSIPSIQAVEKGAPGSGIGTVFALLWLLELGTVSRELASRLETPRLRQRARRRVVDEGLDV